jgi:hypothetical protein
MPYGPGDLFDDVRAMGARQLVSLQIDHRELGIRWLGTITFVAGIGHRGTDHQMIVIKKIDPPRYQAHRALAKPYGEPSSLRSFAVCASAVPAKSGSNAKPISDFID